MNAAAKVGALVILFAVMMLGVGATLQTLAFAKETTHYYVSFKDAGGLTSGARVTMAGVLIGNVETVTLKSPTEAVALIHIHAPHKVPEGSRAVLPSSLLTIGDKEVQIIPGSGQQLAAKATIPGELQSPMKSLLPGADQTMKELNATLVSVQKLLEDQELKGGVTKTLASTDKLMQSAAKTSERFGQLAGRVDGLLAKNSRQFELVLKSAEVSMKNLEVMSGQMKDLIAKGDFQKETMALLKGMNEAVQQGKELVAELNSFVSDPDLRQSVETTTANMAKASESGAKIAKDFEQISANGIEISKQTTELMKKANSLADDVSDLVQDFKKTVGNLPGIGGKPSEFLPQIKVEADILRSQTDNKLRTDVNLLTAFGKDQLMFGMYDAFEGNKINAQIVRRLDQSLDLRYGVYASRPGVGVDYRVAPGLSARADLFGLNNSRLDLRLRYDFGKSLHTYIGLENAFNRGGPVFGIGIRR